MNKAEFIMNKAIGRIKEEFPPLIYAINLLPLKSAELGVEVSCDKEYLLYNPELVENAMKQYGLKKIQYMILHTLLHGLLGHWELNGLYAMEDLLWFSFDREVGHLLEEIGYKHADVADGNETITEYVGEVYDMGFYYKVRDDKKLRIKLWKENMLHMLAQDEHKYWKPKKLKKCKESDDNVLEERNKGEGGDKKEVLLPMSEEEKQELEEKWRQKWEIARGAFADSSGKVDGKSISTTLQTEQQSRMRGFHGGASVQGLSAAKDNENSYYELLMQFLTNMEEQKASPEAIDYMLYQYGLELYGDVPLIEPPDAEEVLVLNTICLAIDTSGSCSGDVASKFLRETYNIFRDLQQVSTGGELYVFQCDAQIQHEEYYERIEDLNQEMEKKKQFYGFGGTSFVPVFERIDKLKEDGKKIDCLIYLSDAYGTFPNEKPEYPVFFVLDKTQKEIASDRWLKRDVPDWVQLVGIG